MEDWVHRALARWPNVPALYGWLRLDRRGRWRIRDELISRPQIVDTINRNYEADAQGRWFFQNGPQRGYVALDYAPFVLRTDGAGNLYTHSDLRVEHPRAAYLDEDGALWLVTEHGPAVLEGEDLQWALARLRRGEKPVDEDALMNALALPSGTRTALHLQLGDARVPVERLERAQAPQRLGFVRDPQPLAGESAHGDEPAR